MDRLDAYPTPRIASDPCRSLHEPGVSITGFALANGVNANHLRRWMRERGIEPPEVPTRCWARLRRPPTSGGSGPPPPASRSETQACACSPSGISSRPRASAGQPDAYRSARPGGADRCRPCGSHGPARSRARIDTRGRSHVDRPGCVRNRASDSIEATTILIQRARFKAGTHSLCCNQ